MTDCITTGWVSSGGAFVTRLEEWATEYFGAGGAVAVSSGTAALHTALLLAGVGHGDEVVVPTLTFIAPANAVRYAGASPVFIDAEPEYWQLHPARLEEFLVKRCRRERAGVVDLETGRVVKAVLPVNVLGHPCDMDSIVAVAHAAGLVVIEDATESLGSRYKGRPAGLLGDYGCVSFNGNKIATAGGGGLVVTRDSQAAERARYLTTQAKDDPLEYVHREVGFNYRLTNVQAAIGLAQVERLDELVAGRRWVAEQYREAFADVPGVEFMPEAPWARSNRWLSAIRVRPVGGGDSRSLLRVLAEHRVEARPLWQPLHRSPAHGGTTDGGDWIADRLNREVLCLPSSPSLTDEDIGRVAGLVSAFARERGRIRPT
ncbi:MAG: aminotransferase class I/II-fold pyridoxal phosphate-dependent enzyme [Actinobacteria bacterium]|nr:aminotransferase class I/II-fold pyridoxal phosphate-dependent enzyme [Actinomycetota bacterium]